MKKIVLLCTAIAITITACFSGMFLSLRSSAADDTVRIMAVGDSITDGYINGDNGYRKYFCYQMQQAGVTNFDMVGSKNDWTNSATYDWNGTTITYDPQHSGYSGYAIQSTGGRSGIMETIFDNNYSDATTGSSGNMLEAYQPDIIMLQIGTNDILDCQLSGIETRLEELVDKILPYVQENGQMLFLASIPIIDVEVRNDWLGSYEWKLGIPSYSEDPEGYTQAVEKAIDEYNAAVKALVEKKQAAGAHIMFSDINSVVDMKTGLYDGVHPNEDGYACMGEYWATLVSSYLNQEITVTTTESSAATTTESSTTETSTETTTSTSTSSSTTSKTTTITSTSTTASTTTTAVTTESSVTTETSTLISATDSTASSEMTTTGEQKLLYGDVNLDKHVTLTDAVTLIKYLLNQQSLTEQAYLQSDMNTDGKVNGLDLTLLRQVLLAGNAQ